MLKNISSFHENGLPHNLGIDRGPFAEEVPKGQVLRLELK